MITRVSAIYSAGASRGMAPAPDETHLVSDGAGVTAESGAGPRGSLRRLTDNTPFGPYRIVRELGRGGMGEVYEAEEIDSGRRVALKLLSRSLADGQARDRFLREGRLAAAVSHPNSVYVFGSHDISGIPAIAMELVSGGTLEDLVTAKGAMAPVDAVAATLQLIAGLEAAEKCGVLHRDIKPSNGFVDATGAVKIGDYGLSMSTTGLSDETRLTMAGTFLGTPAYASPEQVKAGDLDVRSDIYSVGATLYFLLTGQPPFAHKNTMQMLAAVLQDTPASPRALAPAVPEALAQVVLRCLKKDPAARFQTYAQLRQALEPLTRREMAPAPWGRRLAAALIDIFVVAPVLLPLSIKPDGVFLFSAALRLPAEFVLRLIYFAWLESRYGGSLGKRLVGLRVVSNDGSPAPLASTALRAFIWLVAGTLGNVFEAAGLKGPAGVATPLALLLLFSTARNASGRRGIHERLSGTRTVVAAPVRLFAKRRRTVAIARPISADASRTGGYAVRETLWERDGEKLVAAWDTTLERPVWIHHVPASAPVPSSARQACARQTRLRWLSSRRADEENWDAYEAPNGGPLGLESWDDMLAIVSDLTVECEQATADHTMPAVVGNDRIWVSPDGVARITEFPVPDAPRGSAAMRVQDVRSAQQCLHAMAVSGLGGNLSRVALPISVRAVLDRMGQSQFADFRTWSAALTNAGQSAPRVSTARRLMAAGLGALLVVVALVSAISNIPDAYRLHQRPDVEALGLLVNRLMFVDGIEGAEPQWMSRNPASHYTAPERAAFRIHIGDRYQSLIQDPETWRLLDEFWNNGDDEMKETGMRAAADAAAASPDARQRAAIEAAAILRDFDQRQAERSNFWLDQTFAVSSRLHRVLVPFAVMAVIFAFLFNGSIALKMLGCAIAGPDGRRASWFRAWGRTVVAWSPILITYALVRWGLTDRDLHAAVVPATQAAGTVVFIGGALLGLWRPDLSLHDRITGTRVVPK